jgi:uncharacterized protein YutE (UPF0331/DUF86 family)
MPRATDEELLSRLRDNIADIRDTLANHTEEDQKRDEAAMERWLQIAVQVCIDLGDRVLAAKGLEEPTSLREVFTRLAQAGELDGRTASSLSRLAGLRNALVHDYVVYSGPGVFAEAERALPVLEAAAVELADAMNRAKAPNK